MYSTCNMQEICRVISGNYPGVNPKMYLIESVRD